ncbi:MAG: ABC transporter permease [Candidatus Aureabacteria bacterium]|nr:ABC transporter permease [Candidatus Auribacterota bacterium]
MPIVSDMIKRRELLYNLVARNLKIRYKNSFLGFFWTLLHPLFMIIIYMLFIGIMRFPMDLPYLITGVIPWHFLNMCIGDAINVVEGNSTLIKKTSFPRLILPLSTLSANTINLLLSLLVVGLLIPVITKVSAVLGDYHFNLGYLFPAITLHVLLVSGLSLIVAVTNVYFKDTEHIISVILMAWFFMTPIIYPLAMIQNIQNNVTSVFKQFLLQIYYLNPMLLVVGLYRKAFLGIPIPWNIFTFYSIILTVIIFSVGLLAFNRKAPCFADEM